MATYAVTDTQLREIANAIRLKRGIASNITVDDMPLQISLIDGGGGSSDDLKKLIEGTIVTITNSDATKLKTNIFRGCTNLVTVNLPNVTTSGGNYTFVDCYNLENVSLPNITNIAQYAFSNCKKLANVSFPKVTIVNSYGFSSCSGLVTVDLPEATRINDHSFKDCTNLQAVNIPKVSIIGTTTFLNCVNLRGITFQSLNNITNYIFSGCTNLETVIISKENMCMLDNINAFNNTPFASNGTGGTLYVPRALIASYQANTNWNTLLTGNANNQIKAIEDM